MSRLTERDGRLAVRVGGCTKRHDPVFDKLASYEDMGELDDLLSTHQAAVIVAELRRYAHPCDSHGIDEWFPDVCDLAEFCPDGKMAIIACWEQYIRIKLKELKGGETNA